MQEKSDDIIVFKEFDNAIDANIAKTKLDAYDIPCFLTEENMAGLYPGQSFNAFRIRLHLFAADRARALDLLADRHISLHDESTVSCPRCHSERIERVFPKRVADDLIFVLFGIFMPGKKVNHCLDCDQEF